MELDRPRLMDLAHRLAANEAQAATEILETLKPPPTGTPPDDPAFELFFLLRMSARTLLSRHEPADPDAIERLASALGPRPRPAPEFGQLPIDLPSVLRRARVLAELAAGGPVVAIGDDDAVTVALTLEAPTLEAHAVDIDPRVLASLSPHGITTTRADVLGSSVPSALRGCFSAVVCDPFRDLDGALGFLTFAAACLAPNGRLAWVDHADWNLEHHATLDTMATLGFVVEERHADLHSYPVPSELIAPRELAARLRVDPEPLVTLAAELRAWSDLIVMRPG